MPVTPRDASVVFNRGWVQPVAPGGRQNAATGLYIIEHRDYNRTSGTWMQRDPMGLAAGDANLYRFVTNDPINHSDATGLDEKLTEEDRALYIVLYTALLEDLMQRSPSFRKLVDELGGLKTLLLKIDPATVPTGLGFTEEDARAITIYANHREFRQCGFTLRINTLAHELIHVLLTRRQRNNLPNTPAGGIRLGHNPSRDNKVDSEYGNMLDYMNDNFPLGITDEDAKLQSIRDR